MAGRALLPAMFRPSIHPMTHEELSRTLRALDAPYLIDGDGRTSPFGTEFPATTPDGRRVTVTRLDPALVAGLTDVDAFLDVFGNRQHREVRDDAGTVGAGITPAGVMFVVHGGSRDGESLAERLRRDGTVPSGELCTIADQLAEQLLRAHSVSLVHGLVYPETIRLGPDGRVTLGWPGLLSALRAGGLSAPEIGRRLRCTSYVAPEVLGGAVESGASDIYAVGATLYEAMTGRPPFGGRTTATVMAAVLSDDVMSPPDGASDLLTTAVLRAIERDPLDRWHDAGQFRAALAAVDKPVPGGPVRSTRRRRGKAIALLVLGTGAVVLWRVFR